MVGDELLSGRTQDINLRRFSGMLADMGIPVVEARFARDIPAEITSSVRELCAAGRILVVTGGMGPTDDDLTTAAVADAFGLKLFRSPEALEMVRSRQGLYGLGLPVSAFKQADIPLGAIPVLNTAGIAPGLVLKTDAGTVICISGVPSESKALLLPCLEAAGAVERQTEPVLFIRTWGLKENALYDSLRETAARHGVVPAFLPSPGRVDIKVKGPGADGFRSEVLKSLGKRVYSLARDETLEQVLGEKLVERGWFMAQAESCTGGGVGWGITSVAGASRWYAGGVVSYSDSLKKRILGVSDSTLSKHGAVSRETAVEMAEGVLSLTDAHCAVSVTGIAGPSGGTPDKPVGTVWTAAVTPEESRSDLWRLGGSRNTIRQGAAARALGSLLELLW